MKRTILVVLVKLQQQEFCQSVGILPMKESLGANSIMPSFQAFQG
jgi:hypothetical protein